MDVHQWLSLPTIKSVPVPLVEVFTINSCGCVAQLGFSAKTPSEMDLLRGSSQAAHAFLLGECLGHVLVLNLSSQLRAYAYRSISPNTLSHAPRIPETSASMWPRVRKSIAER